jgi:hypothetical protein
MGLSLSLERGHEGHIYEVFKYVQYLICICHLVISCIHVMCAISCIQGIWFVILIVFIFAGFKINHDSHEFILESGTVANSNKVNWESWQLHWRFSSSEKIICVI